MHTKDFSQAAVIFLDILGTHNRQEFDEWYKITKIFYTTIELEKKLDKTHQHVIYKREIHTFSDCAFIIYDFKENTPEEKKDINALMSIACYNTEKVIYEFLKNNFIVRGALTYGDIYYETDKNIYFGPAMNRAHHLESKIAKYPRIIIDPQYAQGLVQYNNRIYRNNEFNQCFNGEIIKRDKDDIYYLNYLSSIQTGLLSSFETNEILNNIISLCNKEINKKHDTRELTNSIKSKYEWLKHYITETQNLSKSNNSLLYAQIMNILNNTL